VARYARFSDGLTEIIQKKFQESFAGKSLKGKEKAES